MKRIISVIMVAVLVFSTAISVIADTDIDQGVIENTAPRSNNAVNYLDYISEYKSINTEDIILFEGETTINRGGEIELETVVASDSWYNIEITYKSTKTDTGEISFNLLVDGMLPFNEADRFVLPRLYKDDGEIRKDGLGNEFTPLQVEVYDIQTKKLSNFSTFSTEESKFFFNVGNHKISFSDFALPAQPVINKSKHRTARMRVTFFNFI